MLENVIPKPRNLGGRPRKTDDEYRGYSIMVSLNEFENAKLQERADSVGLGSQKMRSSFIRKLILNAKINSISPISKNAIIELNRIGQNLNQLTKLANSNNQIDPNQIAQIHAEIRNIGQNLHCQESDKSD